MKADNIIVLDFCVCLCCIFYISIVFDFCNFIKLLLLGEVRGKVLLEVEVVEFIRALDA